MKIVSLILASFLLVSCTVNPFVSTTANGTQIASLGGSIFTKSKSESGEIVKPDGTRIAFTRTGKNETGGVTSSIASYAAGKVAEAWADSRAAVDNAKTAAEVAKAKDASAAAVEQAKIAAEVEKLKIVTPAP